MNNRQLYMIQIEIYIGVANKSSCSVVDVLWSLK